MCCMGSLVRVWLIMASYAAARGPAASRTKFCNHDSFLSASRESFGSLFFIILSSFGHLVSSPTGSPTCTSQDSLILLSTGLGSQKVASKGLWSHRML